MGIDQSRKRQFPFKLDDRCIWKDKRLNLFVASNKHYFVPPDSDSFLDRKIFIYGHDLAASQD